MYQMSLASFACHAMNGFIIKGIPDEEITTRSWALAEKMYDMQKEKIKINLIHNEPIFLKERNNFLANLMSKMEKGKIYFQKDLADILKTSNTGSKFRAVWKQAEKEGYIIKNGSQYSKNRDFILLD